MKSFSGIRKRQFLPAFLSYFRPIVLIRLDRVKFNFIEIIVHAARRHAATVRVITEKKWTVAECQNGACKRRKSATAHDTIFRIINGEKMDKVKR